MLNFTLLLLYLTAFFVSSLREFRSWSDRTFCPKIQWPNYPFAYSKYYGQTVESKGRVNSNIQDFRHECQVRGGRSKCHICETIDCDSSNGKKCNVQLQGVNSTAMSTNIPVVSDTAWAVGGSFRHDYGGAAVTHFCTFITGGDCILPTTTDFSHCVARCFGYGFNQPSFNQHMPAINLPAPPRSIADIYPGMVNNDYQVEIWSYPRNCTDLYESSPPSGIELVDPRSSANPCARRNAPYTPNFNPQGFSLLVAGSGRPGFADGSTTSATFNSPEDIDIDENGNIYVADTLNNAIRLITKSRDGTYGRVVTIAGQGPEGHGWLDGPCSTATFTNPKGIAVRTSPRIYGPNGVPSIIIAVADTGNHRIRQIEYAFDSGGVYFCEVTCFSGLCGNNTLAAAYTKNKASPFSGYADGSGLEARFSAPQGIDFMDGNNLVVADTGNFLLRWVKPDGNTTTLAGRVVHGEKDPYGNPLAGCPPPCLQGEQGYEDGNLTHAQFFDVTDVARGTDNTVFVTDDQRIRIVYLPFIPSSNVNNIISKGWVASIAGTTEQGREDGTGDKANFFDPMGIAVTDDGIAYVADSASCRIRRISPMPNVAPTIKCSDRPVDIIRPSGCTGFDQPIDKIGRKVSRVEANVQYNIGVPYLDDLDRGKYIKNCVGVPPLDKLDKHFVKLTGDNLVIDDNRTVVNEDSEQGTAIMVNCPPGCNGDTTVVEGTHWYSEFSSICRAAMHQGLIDGNGGFLQINLQRRDYLWILPTIRDNSTYIHGSAGANFVTSINMQNNTHRVFSIESFAQQMKVVHTIAGRPSAPLESGCGYHEAQPPTLASYNKPRGVATQRKTNSLDQQSFLVIADSGNNRIRAISAVCTIICENKGYCAGPDLCQCAPGWTGLDCTTPICSNVCGPNRLCVAPATCACKPGYGGSDCTTPQCQNSCFNGGQCSFPDTCSCAPGWFDTNCTTPVCSQTCANGGNCTAPNTCACPSEWTGVDCRIPVCEQTCLNNGFCSAPNTCICPPQWINFDCSVPVCTQGLFKPNPDGPYRHTLYASNLVAMPTYKQCDMISWCNATHEFECDQLAMTLGIIEVKYGPEYRIMTGRKERPMACMNIELPITFKIPFELLISDGTTTGYSRFSPVSPYTSDPNTPWRGYFEPTEDHTGPWTYVPDRQVANVQYVNVSQGVYVCANDGNCTAPGICECAPGWIGFDCRTPVCDQGYYRPKQSHYVSGLETPDEVVNFLRFLGNNTYRLNWTYSNPNYTMQKENLSPLNEGYSITYIDDLGGIPYEGPSDWSTGYHQSTSQGGYRCTIRAFTQWENSTYVLDHPNYYSRYMDQRQQDDGSTYTLWQNMHWPPVHRKSRILDQTYPGIEIIDDSWIGKVDVSISNIMLKNRTYIYTNEGYRRCGIWNRTGNYWTEGTCIVEFYRNCSENPSKEYDLHSKQEHVYVQDTDLAYRPRMLYSDKRVYGDHGKDGRWTELGGECVDHVIRGCKNNGTCVAPNTCACATGWEGYDCTIPICMQTCHHHGNCTLPDICTCEKGWSGFDCSIALCAQECQNGGVCVAPDTCRCQQWANDFRDGQVFGGNPLFQLPGGDPLPTGWTGFDCGTPICVQAQNFRFNLPYTNPGLQFPEENTNVDFVGGSQVVPGTSPMDIIPGYYRLGGHGADDLMGCVDDQGNPLPRCHDYDLLVASNSGSSFQTGCGFDPFDTGCCIPLPEGRIVCMKCGEGLAQSENNTFFCRGGMQITGPGYLTEKKTTFIHFLDQFYNFRMCGAFISPRSHFIYQALGSSGAAPPQDYGRDRYYVQLNPIYASNPFYSSHNFEANYTSARFLCQVQQWTQGDYIDDYTDKSFLDANINTGTYIGMYAGRHVRVNYPNLTVSVDNTGRKVWQRGLDTPGEGIYACANSGSCIAPDVCSCTDGYSGYDCITPLCRHLQPLTKQVSSCLNGGVCEPKDNCNCIQTASVLWEVFPGATRGITGWTGSDCSIPMCSQGYFDPFCTNIHGSPANNNYDVTQGGEGCFRCANGGFCGAPEVCVCAPGWTGYDCKTPVCEVVADPLTRTQLGTAYEEKVISFESDPCALLDIHGVSGFHGRKYTRGNCTKPNQCTCFCKLYYDERSCKKTGHLCDGAWQDNMASVRNVLQSRGPEYIFGSTDCRSGYEGNVDNMTRFTTCHQTIFVPKPSQGSTQSAVIAGSICGFLAVVVFYFARERVKKQLLLAKIERRRSKRSSEESLLQAGAFVNK